MPQTTADNPLKTPYYYTITDDGLKQSWNVGNGEPMGKRIRKSTIWQRYNPMGEKG